MRNTMSNLRVTIALTLLRPMITLQPLSYVHRVPHKLQRMSLKVAASPYSRLDIITERGTLQSRYETYLSESVGLTNGANAIYRAELSKFVIVQQFFPYRQRVNDNARVIEHFTKRQEAWAGEDWSPTAKDKTINPLIAIPGAPGSGKSAFLANFPASDEFQSYCNKYTGGQSAIVAPLTFNSIMDDFGRGGHPTFGLRILFGASMVMRDNNRTSDPSLSWAKFLERFSDRFKLSAKDAVKILQAVYGQDRRVLVLVDDLVKVAGQGRDKGVMEEIGQLLTSSHKVDVLVSALSPEYVKDLMSTTIRREIIDVVLNSLVGMRLGHEQSAQWSKKLFHGKTTQEVDRYAMNLLASVDLLLSGHPRSLQYLVQSFEDVSSSSYWKKTMRTVESAFPGTKLGMPKLLSDVMLDLVDGAHPVYRLLEDQLFGTPAEMVKYLDMALQINIKKGTKFRSQLENGAVYVLPKSNYSSKLRPTIPLITFVQVIRKLAVTPSLHRLVAKYPRVRSAVLLFKGYAANTGELFERAVGLTAVCYSHLSRSSPPNMQTLLGLKEVPNAIPLLDSPELSTRLATTLDEMMIPAEGPAENEYVSAPRSFPGFDGRITTVAIPGTTDRATGTPAQYFYLEARVDPKKRASESDVRMSKVVKALMAHYICTLHLAPEAQQASFANLHVIFYEWGALSKTNAIGLGVVQSAVHKHLSASSTMLFDDAEDEEEALLSARVQFLKDVKSVLSDVASVSGLSGVIEKGILSDGRVQKHMRLCFQTFIDASDSRGKVNLARAYVVNRDKLEQWLVPPVLPIPYLVADIGEPGSATDGDADAV